MAISVRGSTATLAAKHARIETQIAQEAQRPQPDWSTIAQLKKEKLRLKEELSRAQPH